MFHKANDIRIKKLNPAAGRGDLEEVKAIISEYRELDITPNAGTITQAIISGNLELLQFFKDTFSVTPQILSPSEINYAIRNIKNSDIFEHLLTQYRGMRFGLNAETTWIVAQSGNLKNLKLLLSTRIPQATSDTLFHAVKSGNFECVKYLVEDYKIDDKLVITNYDEALALAKEKELDTIANYLQEKLPLQNKPS